MFKPARYLQNSLTVFFPRQATIRRKANDFEDLLSADYIQPQVIPVPDDLEPQIPRLIFSSHHGFSQIAISQVNIALTAIYSPDWQLDINKGESYLLERVGSIFKLIERLEQPEVYFCGLTTQVHLQSEKDDQAVLAHISDKFLTETDVSEWNDIQIRQTKIITERFFSNITISNYREWQLTEGPTIIPRLSRKKISAQGIELLGDYNDRFIFNEDKDYKSSEEAAKEIISQGLLVMREMITELGG